MAGKELNTKYNGAEAVIKHRLGNVDHELRTGYKT